MWHSASITHYTMQSGEYDIRQQPFTLLSLCRYEIYKSIGLFVRNFHSLMPYNFSISFF